MEAGNPERKADGTRRLRPALGRDRRAGGEGKTKESSYSELLVIVRQKR